MPLSVVANGGGAANGGLDKGALLKGALMPNGLVPNGVDKGKMLLIHREPSQGSLHPLRQAAV